MTVNKKPYENIPVSKLSGKNIDPMIYDLNDRMIIKYGGDLSDRYNNPYRLSLDMLNNLSKGNLSTSEMKKVENFTEKLKPSIYMNDDFYLVFLNPVDAQNSLQGILKTSGYKNLNLDQAIDKLYSGRTQSDVDTIRTRVEESFNTKNLSQYKLTDVLKDETWRPLFLKGLQNGNGYSDKSQVENISREEFDKRISDPTYEFKPPKLQKKQKPTEIEQSKETIVEQSDALSTAKLIAGKKHADMGQSNDTNNNKVNRNLDNSPALD